MTLPKPYFQITAQRLMEEATSECDDAAAIASATERAFQRLHEHLSRLIGMVGWRTPLARALKLARAWLPALERIEVKPDGALAGLVEALDAQSRDDALAAPTALLAQLLDLLAAFVARGLGLFGELLHPHAGHDEPLVDLPHLRPELEAAPDLPRLGRSSATTGDRRARERARRRAGWLVRLNP